MCVVNTDSFRDDSNVIEFGSDPSTSCSSVQRISNIRPGTVEDDTRSFHLVFIAQLEDKRMFMDELHQKKRKKKKNPDCCSAQSMNVVFVLWESSQRFQRDQTASKNMPLSGLICSPVGFRVTLQTLQEVYSVWSACGNQPESSLK